MNDICFICRQPVDGLYRRVMPVMESEGQVLGTGYGRVWFTTKAVVSLCSRCDAAEADRGKGAPYDPRISAWAVWIAVLVCIGWIGKGVFHGTGSLVAGYVTAGLLVGGLVLWRGGIRLAQKKGERRETPQLSLQ